MKKMLLVDLTRCTGCEMCVDVCSSRTEEFYSDEASRIRLLKDEIRSVFTPLVCEQCREHPCVDVCPEDAFFYNRALSIFQVDSGRCIGCGACVQACPYGSIFLYNNLAQKCDLCDGDPACVRVCYPKALQFVDVCRETIHDDLENKSRKISILERGADE